MFKKLSSIQNWLSSLNKSYLFLLLFDLALLPIIYFFWKNNNLLNWDFPGHIAQIEYYKSHLLPFLSGWNNEYSLGYPQGDFYPPLVHYFIALLCLIYDNPYFWIKFLFSLTLLSLPFTIFAFVKNFASKVIKRDFYDSDFFVATFVILLTIVCGPVLYGGSLQSFTIVGLLNNFLVLPFFFLFLASVLSYSASEKLDWNYIFKTTFLLTIVMLSHLVAGLVTVVIAGCVFAAQIITLKNLEGYKIKLKRVFLNNFFIFLLLSFFSTAFFYIPLILNQDLVTSQIMVAPDKHTTLGILMVCFALAYIFVQGRGFINKRVFLAFFVPLSFFVIYCAVEILSIYFKKRIFTGIVQSYRLMAFSLFLLPGIATLFLVLPLRRILLSKKIFVKKYINFFLLLLPLLLFITSIFQNPNVKGYVADAKFADSEISKRNNGNYLSLVFYDRQKTYIRTENYSNLITGKNIRFVNVLFAESSYMETIVTSLRKSIDENDVSSGMPSRKLLPDTYNLTFEEVRDVLTLLDVEYILYTSETKFKYEICSNDRFTFAEIKMIERGEEIVPIYGCKVKPEIYVSNFDIEYRNYSWDELNYDFSFDDKHLVYSNYLVNGKGYPFEGKINWWNDAQRFEIIKDGSELAILPVQYNPKWKAFKYDSNGNIMPVDVYRISPNLIGVKDTGVIYFEYEYFAWEKALGVVAIISVGLVLLGVLGIKFKVQSPKLKKN